MNQHWMGGVRRVMERATRNKRKTIKQNRYFDHSKKTRARSDDSFVTTNTTTPSEGLNNSEHLNRFNTNSGKIDQNQNKVGVCFSGSIDLMSLTLTTATLNNEVGKCEKINLKRVPNHNHQTPSNYLGCDEQQALNIDSELREQTEQQAIRKGNKRKMIESQSNLYGKDEENEEIRFFDEGIDKTHEIYNHTSEQPSKRLNATNNNNNNKGQNTQEVNHNHNKLETIESIPKIKVRSSGGYDYEAMHNTRAGYCVDSLMTPFEVEQILQLGQVERLVPTKFYREELYK